MSQRLKIDREAAKTEPESQFEKPDDLVASDGLTRGEKIAALKRWAFLVNRRLASGDEGMPVSGAQEGADAELLRNIERVRSALIAGEDPEEDT